MFKYGLVLVCSVLAMHSAANGSKWLLARLKDNDDIKQWALDEEIRDHHARQLAALEVALEEICHEYHIDINTVKQIAGITNNIKFKTIPDADYLLHIKSEMCGVLDGVKKDKRYFYWRIDYAKIGVYPFGYAFFIGRTTHDIGRGYQNLEDCRLKTAP